MDALWIVPALAGLLALVPGAYAETVTHSFEGGMDAEITYPGEIASGRDGIISVLVRNNGWEDKQDIAFDFAPSAAPGLAVDPPSITIGRLAQGGSFGENVRLSVPAGAEPGRHFLNLRYSQVLVANNEAPQPAAVYDIAIPITVRGEPSVTIRTATPESIFASAEFPMDVEIVSDDIDIGNVTVTIIPPRDIEFRGETQHTFSRIERDSPVGITSRIITPAGEISSEYRIPFEIVVTYTDDIGEEKTDSQTVSLVLRPRTFMELTTDGGIWIGDFFIAPYVSIGTIVGIPAGTLFSILIRRRQGSRKRRRRRP